MSKRLELIVLLVATSVVLSMIHAYMIFYAPPSWDGEAEPRLVEIPRGTSFRVVATNLEKAGVVRDAEHFLFAASVFGAQKRIKAGEYEFTTDMRPVEVIEALVKGKVVTHPVTIPEGFSIKEIAARLEGSGLADAGEFIHAAQDPEFVRELGLKGSTLEGYLFPDTYYFTKGLEAREIIAAMVDRFKGVYADFEESARQRGMDMAEAVTLASIIEKETADPSERRLISAVFHNRLKKGIRLQSDPTVIYAIEDFDGNLTRRHLKMSNPYNTYRNYGLPPGPIASPGRASIAAAVNPAEVEYLYFVSRNDGTHHFSKTLREHINAVNKYQRGRF